MKPIIEKVKPNIILSKLENSARIYFSIENKYWTNLHLLAGSTITRHTNPLLINVTNEQDKEEHIPFTDFICDRIDENIQKEMKYKLIVPGLIETLGLENLFFTYTDKNYKLLTKYLSYTEFYKDFDKIKLNSEKQIYVIDRKKTKENLLKHVDELKKVAPDKVGTMFSFMVPHPKYEDGIEVGYISFLRKSDLHFLNMEEAIYDVLRDLQEAGGSAFKRGGTKIVNGVRATTHPMGKMIKSNIISDPNYLNKIIVGTKSTKVDPNNYLNN